MLTHLSRACPLADPRPTVAQRPYSASEHYESTARRDSSINRPRSQVPTPAPDTSFKARIDRHGRPFGERLPPPVSRGQPLANKIVPAEAPTSRAPPPIQQHSGLSPLYSRDRHQKTSCGEGTNHRHNQQWGAKSPQQRAQGRSPSSSRHHNSPTPPAMIQGPPLGRNLDLCDFPSPTNTIPSREAVLNELREASYQYINCGDLVESAARRQRVLQIEHDGSVDEAADNIIAAAIRANVEASPNLRLLLLKHQKPCALQPSSEDQADTTEALERKLQTPDLYLEPLQDVDSCHKRVILTLDMASHTLHQFSPFRVMSLKDHQEQCFHQDIGGLLQGDPRRIFGP
ncbi:hypothetical protein Rs2_35594 [Raphanus sativus]|nr:hypothetical protein Rs2_35594 [Raphanus sativus]